MRWPASSVGRPAIPTRARISKPPTPSSTRCADASARGRACASTFSTCRRRCGPGRKRSTLTTSWMTGVRPAAGRARDDARQRNREAVRYHLGVKVRMRLAALAFVVAVAPMTAALTQGQAPPGPDSTPSRFPPGPGRDALFRVCANCHGPESVLGHLETHEEWSKTLEEMAGNGATGSDEDWTLIHGYLD